MCGIAGIWNPNTNAPVDLSCLYRMLRSIHHRGPDDCGIYTSGGLGLGHVRLSIVDLEGGHQPMSNEDGSIWVVFNGEIYNHPELRAALVKKGHRFRTNSDTEVIVHLYEDLGEECVNSFNGQFAFAVWDSRNRQLFLARDRMGVRPLFFTQAGGRFLFASEIKALFADPEVPREFDLRALNQVFTFWFPIPPLTGFAAVSELQPGCTMRVTPHNSRITRYWKLQYPSREESEREDVRSEQWYAESLMELLDDAVEIRLRADVPVGAYLSGGLDSSVISALAHRHVEGKLETFSIGFESNGYDESSFQQRTASHLGTRHHPFVCRTAEVGLQFENALWHIERPVVRTAPVPMMLLSEKVREAGIKVVLTGEGADEILAGYDIFKEAKVRRFWASNPDSRFRPHLLRRLYPYMSGIQTQSPAYITAFFGHGLRDTQDPFYSHRLRWQVTSGLKHFYSQETRKILAETDPIADLKDQLPAEFYAWHPLSQAQYLEAAYLLPGYILSSQGDRMGMANAVEGRFPFLDHRVVEFASRIPPNLKIKCLREKHILKQGARRLLPDVVVERAKQPYRAPDHESFFPGGRPHDYIEEALSADRIKNAGVFSASAVCGLIEKARRMETMGTKDGMALAGVLSFQLLYQQFAGQRSGRTRADLHLDVAEPIACHRGAEFHPKHSLGCKACAARDDAGSRVQPDA
jgi:asparagine synthase (glutamine-hydrolysing)